MILVLEKRLHVQSYPWVSLAWTEGKGELNRPLHNPIESDRGHGMGPVFVAAGVE